MTTKSGFPPVDPSLSPSNIYNLITQTKDAQESAKDNDFSSLTLPPLILNPSLPLQLPILPKIIPPTDLARENQELRFKVAILENTKVKNKEKIDKLKSKIKVLKTDNAALREIGRASCRE